MHPLSQTAAAKRSQRPVCFQGNGKLSPVPRRRAGSPLPRAQQPTPPFPPLLRELAHAPLTGEWLVGTSSGAS